MALTLQKETHGQQFVPLETSRARKQFVARLQQTVPHSRSSPLGNGTLLPSAPLHLKPTASSSASASCDRCSVLSLKTLQREMERRRMIMLIAFDRSTESDYRSTILRVTLYPVSEKNLAGLSPNAQIILF